MKTHLTRPLLVPTLAAAFSVVIGLLAGCASEPNSVLVSAPPPQAPTASPAPQTVVTPPQQVVTTGVVQGSPQTYVVVQAPPVTAPPEAVPPRPSNQHVWIPGYYVWQNNRYEWMAGRWVTPPHANATWVNPRWEQENNNYRFYEGYWR